MQEAQRAKEAAAKVRRLDKLLVQPDYEKLNACCEDGITQKEEEFIMSMKDWIDKDKRALTLKQIAWIEDIYQRAYTNDLIEGEKEWMEYLVTISNQQP